MVPKSNSKWYWSSKPNFAPHSKLADGRSGIGEQRTSSIFCQWYQSASLSLLIVIINSFRIHARISFETINVVIPIKNEFQFNLKLPSHKWRAHLYRPHIHAHTHTHSCTVHTHAQCALNVRTSVSVKGNKKWIEVKKVSPIIHSIFHLTDARALRSNTHVQHTLTNTHTFAALINLK